MENYIYSIERKQKFNKEHVFFRDNKYFFLPNSNASFLVTKNNNNISPIYIGSEGHAKIGAIKRSRKAS